MNAGAVHVVTVGPNGALVRHQQIGQMSSNGLLSLDANDNFGGRGLARLGDLDGDGSTEVAVGCFHDDDGGIDRGAAYILSLRATAPGEPLSLERVAKISSTSGDLLGPLEDDDLFGMSVAPLGDLDGDGVPDLAVGSNKDDVGGTDMGSLYLLGLSADGSVARESLIAEGTGFPGLSLIAGERFGRALANFGDIRGDGSTVLGVGAGAAVNGGRIWLVAIGGTRSPDLDGNGTVGGSDLGLLFGGWGMPGPTDLDWSGTTESTDLARILTAWRH